MKELAYRVFVDVWRLACRYRFQKLDDSQWERLTADAGTLFKRYRNTEAESLFRGLFMAVQSFYEERKQEGSDH